MTKIRVTKRAFPRRITYTHLVRPLMRHSSRIKLFTRNWPKSPVMLFSSSLLYDSSNFVPPPPSSTLRGKEKSSAEKKRIGCSNFHGESLEWILAIDPQEETSSRTIAWSSTLNLFRMYREKFEESGSRRFPRNDSSKTGAKRGGWKGREEAEEGGSGIDPLAENIPSRRPTFFHETRRGGGG